MTNAFTPGTYRLFQYSGALGGGARSLVWVGGANTNAWDRFSTTNWFDGVNLTNFADFDRVTFDNTSTNLTANLFVALTPASVTVDSTNNYTIGGLAKLTDATILTKQGSSTLTLSSTNDFTGPVYVNAGTLKQGCSNALGNATSITVSNGAQFDINGIYNDSKAYSFILAGGGSDGLGALRNNAGGATWAGVRNVTLTDDAAIYINARFDMGRAAGVAGGLINGNGHRLTKNGPAEIPFHTTMTNLAELIINTGLIYCESTDYSLGTNVTVNAGARVGAYSIRINNCAVTLNSATLEATGNATPT